MDLFPESLGVEHDLRHELSKMEGVLHDSDCFELMCFDRMATIFEEPWSRLENCLKWGCCDASILPLACKIYKDFGFDALGA